LLIETQCQWPFVYWQFHITKSHLQVPTKNFNPLFLILKGDKVTNPIADSLNREYPEIREALASAFIESQISMLGVAICPVEEDGIQGLILQAFDVNQNLSPLKVSLFPLTVKSRTQRSWFGAIPWDFYVRFYVEEIPELDEFTSDAQLDELFFTTLSTHEKGGVELLEYLATTLKSEFGLQVNFYSPPDREQKS